MLRETRYTTSSTRDLRVSPECSWSVRSNGNVTHYWLFLEYMNLEDGNHRLLLNVGNHTSPSHATPQKSEDFKYRYTANERETQFRVVKLFHIFKGLAVRPCTNKIGKKSHLMESADWFPCGQRERRISHSKPTPTRGSGVGLVPSRTASPAPVMVVTGRGRCRHLWAPPFDQILNRKHNCYSIIQRRHVIPLSKNHR
jgi:hypothetical protein